MTDEDCGQALHLTCQERHELKIRSIQAADMPPQEVAQFYQTKRREKQNERGKLKRQAARAALQRETLSQRERDVLDLIPISRPIAAPLLVEMAASLRSFRKGSGKEHDKSTVHRATHRALDKLLGEGRIADERVTGKGVLSVRVVTKLGVHETHDPVALVGTFTGIGRIAYDTHDGHVALGSAVLEAERQLPVQEGHEAGRLRHVRIRDVIVGSIRNEYLAVLFSHVGPPIGCAPALPLLAIQSL